MGIVKQTSFATFVMLLLMLKEFTGVFHFRGKKYDEESVQDMQAKPA